LHDNKDVKAFYLGGTRDQHKNVKTFKRHKGRPQRTPRRARHHPDFKKSNVRVRKRTEALTLVSHISVCRLRSDYPREH